MTTDYRAYWTETLETLASPVLTAFAERRLKQTMPVEAHPRLKDRADYTHLEALGRLLSGIAPWLETGADNGPEGESRARFIRLAQEAVDAATDPQSPDFLNFAQGQQPLVDTAFLAQAIIRAPQTLWHGLEARVRKNLAAALKITRTRKPAANNWLLFSGTTEAALFLMGEADWDKMRIDYALRQHMLWYVGDGAYGDGPHFCWDYYNSFVIQPMLVDIISTVGDQEKDWMGLRDTIYNRARRYGVVQERLIAPDGTYPVVGRSIAYRGGAFQTLAQGALRGDLAQEISPAQVRSALEAVIHRTMDPPGTFDKDGWLQIGLCGHQPGLGETYISTGSLYLCSTILLPLGLKASDPFWTLPAEDWTSRKLWSGLDAPADHAVH